MVKKLQIQILPTERLSMGCPLEQPQRWLALCPAELAGTFLPWWWVDTHYIRKNLFCLDKNIHPALG